MLSPSNYLPRAERFAIPIAILYRSAGETSWRPALTENISRSGVLFRTDRDFEPDTTLEMMLDMPAIVTRTAAGSALRRGRVVRAVTPASPRQGRRAVAAAFVDSQQLPPVDPRRI
jgi:hypothetical protein